MEIKYEVNNTFLYVTVSGEFVFSSVKDILPEVIEKANSNNLKQILCDLTHMKNFEAQQTSTEVRFNIANLIADLIPIDFRVAILETPMQAIGGRFSENIMTDRGVSVKVTSSIKEALEWLGVEPARKKTSEMA